MTALLHPRHTRIGVHDTACAVRTFGSPRGYGARGLMVVSVPTVYRAVVILSRQVIGWQRVPYADRASPALIASGFHSWDAGALEADRLLQKCKERAASSGYRWLDEAPTGAAMITGGTAWLWVGRHRVPDAMRTKARVACGVAWDAEGRLVVLARRWLPAEPGVDAGFRGDLVELARSHDLDTVFAAVPTPYFERAVAALAAPAARLTLTAEAS